MISTVNSGRYLRSILIGMLTIVVLFASFRPSVLAQDTGVLSPGAQPEIILTDAQGNELTIALVSACLPRTDNSAPLCEFPENTAATVQVSQGSTLTAVIRGTDIIPAEFSYATTETVSTQPPLLTTAPNVNEITIPLTSSATAANTVGTTYQLILVASWTAGASGESYYVEYLLTYEVTAPDATPTATQQATTTSTATSTATPEATSEPTTQPTEQPTREATPEPIEVSTEAVPEQTSDSGGAATPVALSGVIESSELGRPVIRVVIDNEQFIPSGARIGDSQAVFSDGVRRLPVPRSSSIQIRVTESPVPPITVELVNLIDNTTVDTVSIPANDEPEYTVDAPAGAYVLNITVGTGSDAITYFYRLNVSE